MARLFTQRHYKALAELLNRSYRSIIVPERAGLKGDQAVALRSQKKAIKTLMVDMEMMLKADSDKFNVEKWYKKCMEA
jgi:hypothetical protein